MRAYTKRHLVLLGSIVMFLLAGCASAAAGPVGLGQAAPALAVTNLAGAPMEVRTVAGRALWLNFWASWCYPCRAEWPALNQAQPELAAIGMDLVAISVNERPRYVSSFLESHPAAFMVALDQQGAMAARYSVVGLPTHVLIDRMGVVRAIVHGPLDAQRARRLLGLTDTDPMN
jgi:cytochrome c biogenesis protein CcmG, thiol:disulfide interchange protein DsbE